VLREGAGEVEIRFRHFKTGAALWMIYNVFQLRDGAGRVIGYATASRDITRRKRAEAIEERLRTLLDHNPSLVFMKDEAGRYGYLNEAYEKWFVHSKDWLGKTDFDFWPKEAADLFRKDDAEVLRCGETKQFLEDSRDLTGKRYCWLCYKFPFTGADGKRYVGGVGIDATGQIEAEERLQRERARLQTVVEALPVGVWVADASGKMVLVNKAAVDIFSGHAPAVEEIAEYGVYKVWWPGTEELVRVEDFPLVRAGLGDAEKPGRSWVRFWVEDQGIGISKEMLPRVFDMFSRASKDYEGTGIGLALVRKVVQRMGGKVGVVSEEGKGSRFWFELKDGEEKQSAIRLAGPARAEGTAGEATVLYVEDEESDAVFMGRAFGQKGLGGNLQVVSDGRAAIEYLSGSGKYGDRQKHPAPTLVLLDLNLPQVSGFEVLAWIRNNPDYARMPVVVFSSSTRADDRLKAEQLGANEFVAKPSSGIEFGKVVEHLQGSWLGGSRASAG
jgi:PAS domain S-box-containing protein